MQTFYSRETIASWERFYRANFINTMSGFKSASLIASRSKEGHNNLAIFSNIVHLGADPPLIGFVNRPIEAAPHTITNIKETGSYTINLITLDLVEKAHQSSAKYDRHINEFEATGIEEEYREGIPVPFVKSSPVKYALELKEIIPITYNGTFFVIGEVTGVIINNELLQNDGFLQLENANVITSLGIDAYYSTTLNSRYEYAKPNSLPKRKNRQA